MNIPVKYLMIVSLTGFALSLLIHFLTWANWYLISNFTVLLFTAGVLIVWLQSGHTVKEIEPDETHSNSWSRMFALCPIWLKYVTFFLIIYGVLNFILSAEFHNGNRWIDLQVSRNKIRGVSGIWMAFYAVGFMVGYVKNKLTQRSKSAEREKKD